MCLVTKQKKAKIAKKDITVYKKVCLLGEPNRVISPMQGFEYILGEEYSTNLSPVSLEGSIVNTVKLWDDIVAIEYFKGDLEIGERMDRPDLTVIQEGFHAFKTKDRCPYNAICTIPKGSEYFEDSTGLIVSNQIIIKEIIMN